MLDIPTLIKLNRPIPRYTSYPTAPQFREMSAEEYLLRLERLAGTDESISLYIHIPFCKTMCLFCACSVTLNRKPEKQARYLKALFEEMRMVRKALGKRVKVTQLHFGGGTPTSLSEEEFTKVMAEINENFEIDYSQEVSIEIDPRTVYHDQGKKLQHLKSLGFNRVSFGVQDTNPKVQEAIKRRQSYEMTHRTFELAKEMNFSGINLDLIYGLPLQTPETFDETTDLIVKMKPDRIALFSYAKVPWLKPHQKAIADSDLPSTEKKFQIYVEAREKFLQNGYTGIGMDHFSLKEDSLTKAYFAKKLYRNFQGYAVCFAENMIGLGNSSIGYVSQMYVQNTRSVEVYQAQVAKGILPAALGKSLSEDDQIRKWVIHKIMCDFVFEKGEFLEKFGLDFDTYFSREKPLLEKLVWDHLIIHDDEKIEATDLGRLFIRNVASVFDRYFQEQQTVRKFSQSV